MDPASCQRLNPSEMPDCWAAAGPVRLYNVRGVRRSKVGLLREQVSESWSIEREGC